jgi:hypothetical protein
VAIARLSLDLWEALFLTFQNCTEPPSHFTRTSSSSHVQRNFALKRSVRTLSCPFALLNERQLLYQQPQSRSADQLKWRSNCVTYGRSHSLAVQLINSTTGFKSVRVMWWIDYVRVLLTMRHCADAICYSTSVLRHSVLKRDPAVALSPPLRPGFPPTLHCKHTNGLGATQCNKIERKLLAKSTIKR